MRKISFKKVSVFLLLSLVFLLFSCGVNEESPLTPNKASDVTSEKEFFENMLTSALAVTTETSGGSATVIFEEDGDVYALTNRHVIEGADEIYLSAHSYENERHTAHLLWQSEEYDIAILKAEGLKKEYPGLTPVIFQNADLSFVGQKAYIVGNFDSLGVSLTHATVGRVGEYLTLPTADNTLPFIRLYGNVVSGASGGPVFDETGALLGIVTARHRDTNYGYALDARLVQSITCQVLEKGYATSFNLGLTLENCGGIVKNEEPFVTVKSLEIGSLASAFLKEGDKILSLKINDETYLVTSSHLFSTLLVNVKEGDGITIKYIRDGKEGEYTFTAHKSYIKNIK